MMTINKSLLVIIIAFLVLSCKPHKPKLEFSNYTYDFGHIKKDSIYLGHSQIRNTGNDTLKIMQISVDCSCTKVEITKHIILPNDSAIVKFKYRTFGKKGKQENFITIVANTDSLIHLLQINSLVK